MGKKFATFGQDGVLSARYDSDVHGKNIPDGAVEISAADFKRSILEMDGTWVLGDGAKLEKRPFAPSSLDDLKLSKLAEIDTAFEQEIAPLLDGYPVSERLTWPVQQAEALAWKADPESKTPYLDSIADARGIDAKDLRVRVLSMAEQFITGTAPLLGKRQRLRDVISGANTVDELRAIQW